MMKRAQLLRLLFLAITLLLLGSMLLISAFGLWRLRSEAITNGLETAAMHSRGFEDLLTQSLRLTAMITAANLENERPRSDPAHVAETFATVLHHAPFLRSLSLLNEDGRVTASSNLANIGLTVSTAAFLPPTGDELGIMRVGAPWAGRDLFRGRPSSPDAPVESDDLNFVPLVQKVTTLEGTVTLLIALNPDYFVNHFAQKLDAAEGSVDVLRYDGTLLMTTTASGRPGSLQNAVVSAFDLVQTEFGQFEQEPAGSSTSKSTVARPALTAFRASRLYPVVVVTRIDRDYALRNWKTASITLASVALPVLLGLTLLSVAYYRRQMLQAAQREESARLKAINATVFDSSTEATLITGVDEAIVSINAAFTRVTGYAANDIIGRHLDELLVPESPGEANDQSQQGGETSRAEPPTVEVQLRCKDGSHLWMEILSTPERDAAGRIVGYRRIGRNITERREMQDRVRELAFHDPLTGLPNRRLLGDRLGLAMAQSKRSGTYGAVLFLDLDNFKPLNDQHGHAAGDQLLIEVARRLHGCVREIDTVARFGGDEFVVILGALHATRDESLALARNVAEKVGTVLARPYHLNVRQHDGTELAVEHTCTSSIGATLYFDNEVRQEEVLKRADSAMYRAKKEGRNRICFAGVDAGEAALAV